MGKNNDIVIGENVTIVNKLGYHISILDTILGTQKKCLKNDRLYTLSLPTHLSMDHYIK